MIKYLKKIRFRKSNSKVPYIILMIFTSILMLGVLSVLVLNTAGLDRQFQQHMLDDAGSVSSLQNDNISNRVKMRHNYIVNLADTFSRMPDFLLTEDLLERKAQYLEMDRIFVFNSSDSTALADEDFRDMQEYIDEHPEILESPQIFYMGNGEIFYSAPIPPKDGGDTLLLIGARSNAVLQQMLQEVDLKKQRDSCIVDRDGSVIVEATDKTLFKELEKIFNENQREQSAEIRKVIEDIEAQRSGTVKIKAKDGQSLMLCYDFLNINDWILLTIFPTNLFTGTLNTYLGKYVFAIVVLILAMILTLIYIMWSNRRSLRKIQSVAFYDSLTGGKNGQAFQIEGEKLLQGHPQWKYTIVYLNIRDFKRFNERFGVKTGNEVLRKIYQVLQSLLGEEELISRWADDHFYLLMKCGSEEVVRQRLETMFDALERELSGRFLIDRSCIAQGAYLIPKQKLDIRVLQDRAKMASTYQFDTKICRFYDKDLSKQKEKEQWLLDSFGRALKNHEFQLYLQPKVCPESNRVEGGEVLVRWENPKYGLLFPGDFITFFEQNNKICELDFYMFEETCRLLKRWLEEGTAVPLSVNLSRAHLYSGNLKFLERLKSIKEAYGIPDGWIELELTESLMFERREVSLVMTMIDCIRDMGLCSSLDDFGFGYSSLSLLKDLNVNTVKLDRQFFLNESEKSWIVVRQLIKLAHNLGMTVVAEGIEEQEQVERLKKYKCDLIQGYVYAKPMPVLKFWKRISEKDGRMFLKDEENK